MQHDKSSLREKIKRLTPEKREELNQYAESIKEIKRKINEMLNEVPVNETGGPNVDLHLNTEE